MTPTLLTRRGFLARTAAAGAALATAPVLAAANRSQVPGPVTQVGRRRGQPIFFLDGKP